MTSNIDQSEFPTPYLAEVPLFPPGSDQYRKAADRLSRVLDELEHLLAESPDVTERPQFRRLEAEAERIFGIITGKLVPELDTQEGE